LKFAITGGGGPFGLNLARFLLAAGHQVIGCGRSALKGEAFTLGADRMGYRYRVFAIGPDNEFIADWLEAEQPDVIVNFAAQGEGAASFKARNWKYFYRTNVDALVELTEMLLGKPWLKRFIQVGSSEVYGGVIAPADELAPLRPTSPYAVSKAAFDMHVVSIAKGWGFPGLVVRPSNCITPGQQVHRVVPKAFILGLTGRKLPLHGGGAAAKSYMAATDLSRAIALLAEAGQPGEIYNAGPEQAVTVKDLVGICAEAMHKPLEQVADVVADRTGQDSCYWIDSSKLAALGWHVQIPLAVAVLQVHRWVRDHLDVLKALPLDYEMRA
jgi:dTDP-glucose 4,6-dehydratase